MIKRIENPFSASFILVLFLLFGVRANTDNLPLTEIVVISSMHGAHKDHPSYSYDTLYSLIGFYEPDFVGVEIRPEDIGAADDYLERNYPKEMIALTKEYQGKVFGFDWLGESISGLPISDAYWKNLEVKQLGNLLLSDQELLSKKPVEIEALEEKQKQLLLTATPESLNEGRYGQLCRQIDSLEQGWLNGTPFQKIIDFDRMRDDRIGENISAFIDSHRGQTIVIVLGADHRTYALETIKKAFKEGVKVLSVVDL